MTCERESELKILKIAIVVFFLAFSLNAEAQYNYDSPFGWMSPEVMAQGGSFTAIASGFNSLMTNPAGFAMGKKFTYEETVDESGERVVDKKEKGEVTIVSVLPYATINPFTLYEDISSEDGDVFDAILEQSSANGLGAGMEMGMGYVGHGFGFGLISTLDMDFPQTDNVLGVDGDVTLTAAFIGGYAYLFHLGPVGLSVGADIRPMWRIKAIDIDIDTLTNMISGDEVDYSAIDVLTGLAIGFDAGVIAEWNMLALGISFRDIGHTRYLYQQSNGEDILDDYFSGSDYEGLDYITPMTMRLGLAVHPDLGAFAKIVDPKVHVEYVITMIDYDLVASFDEQSFWSNLNAGAEIRLLSFLSLRAGLSSGYLTAGFGLDLFIAEINAALYSLETGSHSGSSQQMGASVEFAFRF
jgi:hypothetical protein